jgi:DegV family protein with EDD domain
MATEIRKDVGFVTDSGADLDREEAAQKGIRIVDLEVRFRYSDNTDYILQKGDNLLNLMRQYPDHLHPKTSQPSPGKFLEAFNSFPEETTIFCVDIAKGKEGKQISGTYDSAEMAANMINSQPEEYGGRKVHVLNSGTVSSGTRAILMNVFDKVNSENEEVRESMKNPEDIFKELEDVKNRLRFYAYLRDLSYVADRLGNLKYLLGTILNVVPILRIHEDEIDKQTNARGSSGSKRKLVELLKEEAPEDIGVMHFAAAEEAEEMKERIKDELKEEYGFEKEIPVFEAQELIGSYVGPTGAVGAYRITKK